MHSGSCFAIRESSIHGNRLSRAVGVAAVAGLGEAGPGPGSTTPVTTVIVNLCNLALG